MKSLTIILSDLLWIEILDKLTRRELVYLFTVSKKFRIICIETLKYQLSQRQPFRQDIDSLSIRDLQLSSRTPTSNRLLIMNNDFTEVIEEIIKVDDIVFATHYSELNIYFLIELKKSTEGNLQYYLHYGKLSLELYYGTGEIVKQTQLNSLKKIELKELENKNINFIYGNLYSIHNGTTRIEIYEDNFQFNYIKNIIENKLYFDCYFLRTSVQELKKQNIIFDNIKKTKFHFAEGKQFILLKSGILKIYKEYILIKEYKDINDFEIDFKNSLIIIVFNDGRCVRNYSILKDKRETNNDPKEEEILKKYFVKNIQITDNLHFAFVE